MTHVSTLTLPAPAKLNLFLNILDRRPDGYHNLQTVFQFIDFADQLEFTLRDNDSISLDAPNLDISPSDNLIYRAAKLLQETTQTTLGAHIHLDKVLPMGGGVGGGSSNAATTLVALNHLWQTGLSRSELMRLGSTLGADVPIFIHGEAAYATGTGAQLTPIECPESWYALVIPPVNVSTAEIFSHPQLTRDNQPITISDFLSHGGPNSLEGTVRKLYPEVGRALDWLSQFGSARMSGSGCSVFASFAEKRQAENVVNQIPAPFKGVVAKGSNKSPLYLAIDWGVAKR
jgi:4-diphosphocytidyl-2-C-methyl-D-erythritol kinase